MATTRRVRSQLVQRANGSWTPDETIEITTDESFFDFAAELKRLQREVYQEELEEIARRNQEDRLIESAQSRTNGRAGR